MRIKAVLNFLDTCQGVFPDSKLNLYGSVMSSVLTPSYATMAAIRTTIQNTLKGNLPSEVLVNAIAPLLTTVNLWSNQIPAVLEGSGSTTSASLVFGIRKDLFIAPLFSSSVMGIPLSGLPPPFQEFMAFIQKLIEAQKNERDKSVPRVFISILSSFMPFINVFL